MNTVKKRRFLSWKNKVDAVFRIENGKMKLLLEGSDSSKNRAVLQVLQKHREE